MLSLHQIYLNDWTTNAGIVGFLSVVDTADLCDTPTSPGLKIHSHKIEFTVETLDGFEHRYRKRLMTLFFEPHRWIRKLNKQLNEIELALQTGKTKGPTLSKRVDELEKYPFKGLLNGLGVALNWEPDMSLSDYRDTLQAVSEIVQAKFATPEAMIDWLVNPENSDGAAYIDYFLIRQMKSIGSAEMVPDCLNAIRSGLATKIKPNATCIKCNERKAEFDLSNAISNITGFNKDNLNWVWGYKASNVKLCPICALIECCAVLASFRITEESGNFVNKFYFLNQNATVETLYNSIRRLQLEQDQIRSGDTNPFIKAIQRILDARAKQASYQYESIQFIECSENPILGGQSSKGYNVLSYNLTPKAINAIHLATQELAEKSYFRFGDISGSVAHFIIKKAIGNTLAWNDVYFFTNGKLTSLEKSKGVAAYSLHKVCKVIFGYLSNDEGDNMTDYFKNGFDAGKDFRSKTTQSTADNNKTDAQIRGLCHQFLNDLKVDDFHSFMDRYFRLAISKKVRVYPMIQQNQSPDRFRAFGYGFINGLLGQEPTSEANS